MENYHRENITLIVIVVKIHGWMLKWMGKRIGRNMASKSLYQDIYLLAINKAHERWGKTEERSQIREHQEETQTDLDWILDQKDGTSGKASKTQWTVIYNKFNFCFWLLHNLMLTKDVNIKRISFAPFLPKIFEIKVLFKKSQKSGLGM